MNRWVVAGALVLGAILMAVACEGPSGDSSGAPGASTSTKPPSAARLIDGSLPKQAAARVPDNPRVDVQFTSTRDGLDYSIVIENVQLGQGQGHLNEGDATTIDLYGILTITATVRDVWSYSLGLQVVLTGLVEENVEINVPFGEYTFYWGNDRGRIPPPDTDDVQAWVLLEPGRVTYNGEGNIVDYSFHASGEVTRDGQIVDVDMPFDYLLEMKFRDLRAERKTVDVNVTDKETGGTWWAGTIGDLPDSTMVLEINFDGM